MQWPAIRSWPWPIESIIEADLKTTWNVAQELNVNHSMVVLHWNKLERWKSSVSGCHRSWLQITKNCLFEVLSSLIRCNCTEPFLDQIVMCNEKWILYNQWWLAQCFDLEAPKQTCTKKRVMVSLVVCCRSNPLQLSESWWNHYIWEVYSANDERHWKLQRLQPLAVSTGQQKAPSSSPWQCMSHNQHFKSWTNWAMKFCLIHHIHLTSQLFAGKTLTQPAGCRKCFARVHQIPKDGFLCYRSKQTFLVGKTALILMVPILVNKDVWA